MTDEKRVFHEWLNRSSGFFYTVNKTLYKGKTRFQEIELVDTDEFGKVLLLDGVTQVAERNDWQYHEPMVHMPLLSHPRPEQVLVVGGGDGGILREVLKHPTVTHVDLAELDEEVVAFSREYLPEISGGAFDDPRVSFHITDGRAFVESCSRRYDAVIMDMTDPAGPSEMLYTREFFSLVERSLRDDRGVFAMHSESPITRPVAYQCIRKTLGAVFGEVHSIFAFIQMYATLWSITTASQQTSPRNLPAGEVSRRIKDRGLSGLHMIDAENWQSVLAIPPYVAMLDGSGIPVITDEKHSFPDNFAR
ncbi:MAG TPA: polyamine aminopropyltransferase [Spirochaetia bacterium]|nr:polyamine aminopropyltransferase [Spirochaetia bacterium]